MSELSPCRRTPVEAFTEARDHRSPIWDRVLAPGPDLFEAHLNFAALLRQDGVPESQAAGSSTSQVTLRGRICTPRVPAGTGTTRSAAIGL